MIKKEDIKLAEQILYKFIWKIKPSSNKYSGRIKRQTLKAEKGEGGLRAPCIDSLNKAIKYKHILRCLNNEHPIATLTKFKLRKSNINLGEMYANHKLKGTYIGNALDGHNTIFKQIQSDISMASREEDQRLHVQYYKCLANHLLAKSPFLTTQQSFMINNLRIKGIKTLGQLKIEKDNMNNRTLIETFQLWNSFPIEWRKIINASRRWRDYVTEDFENKFIRVSYNKWIKRSKVTIRDLTNCFKSTNSEIDVKELCDAKHQILEVNDINPFKMCAQMSINTRVKDAQYKMLHNAYPTMDHLYKWNIKDTPNCNHCNVPEKLSHAIWDCPIAQDAYAKLKYIYEQTSNKVLMITKGNVFYGIQFQHALNTILCLIKRELILQRENKTLISEARIKAIIHEEMSIEKYIIKKNNNCSRKFEIRWRDFS